MAELERRTVELAESVRHQSAASDILSVVSWSKGDTRPVFDAIVSSAARLLAPCAVTITTLKDNQLHWNAFATTLPDFDDRPARAIYPIPFDPARSASARAMLERRIIQISDTQAANVPEFVRKSAAAAGFRSATYVPLTNQEKSIGTIILVQPQVGHLSERQLASVKTFADQAVIAIENARLFKETQEALAHRTATSEVLQAIGNSMADTQPVFERILDSVERLFDIMQCSIMLNPGDGLVHLAARRGVGTEALDRLYPVSLAQTMAAEVLRAQQQAYFPDARHGSQIMRRVAETAGNFSMVMTPMVWAENSIGVLNVSRAPNAVFSEKELGLLRTFADQAVIAIQNTQLFNETQEALQQQTATAEVLKVIASSPTDVDPVLHSIVESACELCEAMDAVVLLRDGDDLRFCAHHGPIPINVDKWPIGRNWVAGRAFVDRIPVHVPDIFSEGASEYTASRKLTERAGSIEIHSVLAVPLLREGESIGAILLRRQEERSFDEKQIALLQTFADQAVIAIGNVRLFEEVQAKTRELSEALTHQIGSANILRVIASSPTDINPVLKSIVESACELCDAYDATVVLQDGEDLKISAHHGPIPIGIEKWPINRRWTAGRAFLDQMPVHIEDLRDEKHSDLTDGRELSLRMGHRTTLSVPLLREGKSIGAIALRRTEVSPFTDKQIALLQTFADEAVIAIGNVRMFEDVQAKTRELSESLQQQTATADVLQVISASPGELEPVFETMLSNAMRLCEASNGVVWLREGDGFRSATLRGPWHGDFVEQWRRGTVARPGSDTPMARAVAMGAAAQVEDLTKTEAYRSRDPLPVAAADVGGIRTALAVPMLREGECIGVFALSRREVRPFTKKQIEFVTDFAKQAVIAIQNAHLLNELRKRTTELSQSLDDLRTAQDRLVQTEKLASLGQLTAGIAHEIKNPLNFVNNFSALSAELTDELNDLLKDAALTDRMREEVEELTRLLHDNLEKVVQHGRRADSIVKNMLLHSREGSGEHRLADINAIVDESLNLAYHGARAEKPNLNVTMQRSFDPAVGTADVYPQEITRVLLNLISNGFYAAAKRKTEAADGFEPTVIATTKDLGDNIEIRIRDNGTGIPDEVKVKIFNPFFTTKPAGEGTGLGLSMSHDIIVKQHGGSIDVETEPGQFTEFRIVLPRTNSFTNKH